MARDTAPTRPTIDPALDRAWRADRHDVLVMAARMLGDRAAAEDVVQDAFDRLARERMAEIDNVSAWLSVVVRRLCLNRLRSAYARRERAAGATPPDEVSGVPDPLSADPADRITLDDQIQLALSVVLHRLSPAERTSFVLHDVFGFAFDEVAEIVGRTPAACRQLASRARRSVRSDTAAVDGELEPANRTLLSERFIAACHGGDLAELVAVLDPDVVGEATLLGSGPLGGAKGARQVAIRTLQFFGPETGSLLVPVSVEGQPGIVAILRDGSHAVVRLGAVDGLVGHIETFVSRLART